MRETCMNLPINPSDKILIIAPHADDESIGCGGLMATYGSQCDILLLTDGRKGYDSRIDTVDEEQLVRLRKEELRRAAALCGIEHVLCLDIPDGCVDLHADRITRFDITGYDYLFVPNQYERHKDHFAAAKLALRMKKQQHARAQIYAYEVWSPIPTPTVALDITHVIETKRQMVAQYQTQIKYKDYVRMAMGLNQYRGVGFDMEYAEVYAQLVSRTPLQQLYDRLPNSVRKLLRKLRHA